MTKAKATFEWNEETTNKAVSMYEELIANNDVSTANSKASLEAIAKEIGAASAQSVRSKLSNEKVYQKAATPRKVGGTSKITKAEIVRGLQKAAQSKGVELNPRKLESLEHGTGADLNNLVDLLNAYGAGITFGATEQEAPAPKQVTAKA